MSQTDASVKPLQWISRDTN